MKIEKPLKKVSERMKKVKRSGTKIENEMKSFLDELDVEYEEQPKIKGIQGTPDFRIRDTKILLFCDSSFWHGRRESDTTGKSFNRNKDFWTNKLKRNRERDKRLRKTLRKFGWKVYRFWDTEILKNPDKVKKKLIKIKIDNKLTGFSAVDIFCGVGAVTHGLIKAGIPVNAGIDNDESCRYAYEKNNRTEFINEDVRKVSGSRVKKLYPKGDVKILVGCAPCQPFSTHTQKNKKRHEDEKWGLLYSFSRLVEEIEPEIVSMENVLQIRGHEVFTDFVKKLEELNYHVYFKSVYCPDYGIPQKRRRLVLLASKFGKIELLPRTHEPSKHKTVRDAIGKLEPLKSGECSKKDPLHRTSKLEVINEKRIRQSKPGGTWLEWNHELRSPCHKKESGSSYTAVYSRMEWDKPSPTITTQFYNFGTGRFGHPEQDRALSLREGAILQTFPKRYDFIDPKSENLLSRLGVQIGNAVPVKLGTVIGKSILKHLVDTNAIKFGFQIDD